jgi:hypothetical protein
VLPMIPGTPERRTHYYARHGVTCSPPFNIADGTPTASRKARRNGLTFITGARPAES